jgi:hypothetical protein
VLRSAAGADLVSLRIACDLDGVLADMDRELVRQAEILFGETVARRRRTDSSEPPPAGSSPGQAAAAAPPPAGLNLTIRQERRLWRHVESIEDFWLTLDEIEPGSVAALAKLAAERRWEIIFLTRRPQTAGRTAQIQTQRWLETKGFPLPSVFVVHGSRGRIADALGLDIVIDDRPENCLDVVVESKARAILIWRDDEQLLPSAVRRLGIGVVKSVGECLKILTEADSIDDKRDGLVDRLRRLLGLKEPATA